VKVVSPRDGVTFYRVKGTNGWIFDKREGVELLEELSSSGQQNKKATAEPPWSIDFVRGAAASVRSLKEVMWDDASKVVSFRDSNGLRINVFYESRTVSIVEKRKTLATCKDCSAAKLAEIFRDPPLVEVPPAEEDKPKEPPKPQYDPVKLAAKLVAEEEAVRRELHESDKAMQHMLEHRSKILQKAYKYDMQRAKMAAKMKLERMHREQELERAHQRLERLVTNKLEEVAQREEQKRQSKAHEEALLQERQKMLQERTCEECLEVFESVKACEKHCKKEHDLECKSCKLTFRSFSAMEKHCETMHHY
jgi:hypothetical protein